MKKATMNSCNLFVCLVLLFLTGCGWNRIGSLTMISTRNIDSKENYKLIKKGIEGESKMKYDDAFQEAVEDAVKQFPEGEFMKNVVVYVSHNGKRIRVNGDVWGVPSVETNITQKVTADIVFAVGDKVAFKNNSGRIVDGNIVGITPDNMAMVEYYSVANSRKVKDTFSFDKLTKIQSPSSNTPAVINEPAKKPAPTVVVEKQMYKVTSETLRMKEGPNLQSAVLMKLNNGSVVELIEKTNTDWWKVKYGGVDGYVQAKYLSKQ